MSGKGSKPRPFSVSDEEYSDSFERIFGKKESPLENAGYESCKETDTDRTRAAQDRAPVNR